MLFVSLLSGCCAISGFGHDLGLADHLPQFHARALNPNGQVTSRRLTHFGLSCGCHAIFQGLGAILD